jgi:hypothetical protein
MDLLGIILTWCACVCLRLLSGVSPWNDRFCRRWQVDSSRRRACATWAISVWRAVEPGITRRSDRQCGPRYKKESSFLMAAAMCNDNFPVSRIHCSSSTSNRDRCSLVRLGLQFQQVVPEPALRIWVGNHAGQVSDSTAGRPCEVAVFDSEKVVP